jgi:hypothetical protein
MFCRLNDAFRVSRLPRSLVSPAAQSAPTQGQEKRNRKTTFEEEYRKFLLEAEIRIRRTLS